MSLSRSPSCQPLPPQHPPALLSCTPQRPSVLGVPAILYLCGSWACSTSARYQNPSHHTPPTLSHPNIQEHLSPLLDPVRGANTPKCSPKAAYYTSHTPGCRHRLRLRPFSPLHSMPGGRGAHPELTPLSCFWLLLTHNIRPVFGSSFLSNLTTSYQPQTREHLLLF